MPRGNQEGDETRIEGNLRTSHAATSGKRLQVAGVSTRRKKTQTSTDITRITNKGMKDVRLISRIWPAFPALLQPLQLI
jgi:hypothetical protein